MKCVYPICIINKKKNAHDLIKSFIGQSDKREFPDRVSKKIIKINSI